MNNNAPILLLEDDLVDVMAVRRALLELKIPNRLDVAGNGEEGLARLRDPLNQKPAIILLDLNMPRMNGIDFLKALKADEQLRRIPVVVLTTSKEQRDLIDTFGLGISGYMVKPVAFREFIEVVRTIQGYWKLSEQPP
jgi:CheY-like chemotaxis protein